MDNKNVFANNLKKYMTLNETSRKDISNALGVSYYTITDWVNGKKYPRMDKVEKLANYFGILKSDLIEDNTDNANSERWIKEHIVHKINTDDEFFQVVKQLYN